MALDSEGVKSAGFPSEHNKQESRHDHGGKQSDTSSLSGRAAAQAVGSAPKVRDMGSLQPRRTASPATSPDEDAKSEESGVVLVREDAEPKTKPKAGRERMREKDEGSADAAYRSQAEGRSPDELRRLQLQQQLRLQHLYQVRDTRTRHVTLYQVRDTRTRRVTLVIIRYVTLTAAPHRLLLIYCVRELNYESNNTDGNPDQRKD